MQMMKLGIMLMVVMSVFLLLMSMAQAAEMDHSQMDHSQMDHSQMDHSQMDHSQMDHSQMDHSQMAGGDAAAMAPLKKLAVLPASGRAREGGADGRYMMESTSVHDSVAAQCAKASRGLVMLDNAAWAQCGGKPQGLTATSEHLSAPHQHAGHQMP